MVNTRESAIKIVSYDKRKWLLRLDQNGKEVGTASLKYAFVTHTPPGQQQAPNPTYLCKWNVETPYRSPSGDSRPQGFANGGAGVGYWKKRMPCCNGADTGFNVTRRESGPTSDWWYVARKLVEPLVWGECKWTLHSACAPPTLSQDMYNGCGCVSRRSLGEHPEFPGQ